MCRRGLRGAARRGARRPSRPVSRHREGDFMSHRKWGAVRATLAASAVSVMCAAYMAKAAAPAPDDERVVVEGRVDPDRPDRSPDRVDAAPEADTNLAAPRAE